MDPPKSTSLKLWANRIPAELNTGMESYPALNSAAQRHLQINLSVHKKNQTKQH